MEILHKTKNILKVLFCIYEAVVHQWDKYTLRDVLKAGILFIKKCRQTTDKGFSYRENLGNCL